MKIIKIMCKVENKQFVFKRLLYLTKKVLNCSIEQTGNRRWFSAKSAGLRKVHLWSFAPIKYNDWSTWVANPPMRNAMPGCPTLSPSLWPRANQTNSNCQTRLNICTLPGHETTSIHIIPLAEMLIRQHSFRIFKERFGSKSLGKLTGISIMLKKHCFFQLAAARPQWHPSPSSPSPWSVCNFGSVSGRGTANSSGGRCPVRRRSPTHHRLRLGNVLE